MIEDAHLSDFTLDRLRAGEPVSDGASGHLLTCASCQARHASLLEHQETFVPDANLMARLSATAIPANDHVRFFSSHPRWRKTTAAATTALAASVAAFLLARGPNDEGVRSRGVGASFFVDDADGSPRPVSDLTRVPSGAPISLQVQGPGTAVAIWYVRTGRELELIYPSASGDAFHVSNGVVRLQQPIVLDDDRRSDDRLRIAVCVNQAERARALAGDDAACPFVDERVRE